MPYECDSAILTNLSRSKAIFLDLFSALPSNYRPLQFTYGALRTLAGGELVPEDEINEALEWLCSLGFFLKTGQYYTYCHENLQDIRIQNVIACAREVNQAQTKPLDMFSYALWCRANQRHLDGVGMLSSYLEDSIYKRVQVEDLIALELAIQMLIEIDTGTSKQYSDEEAALFCQLVLRLQTLSLHRGKYACFCLELFTPACTLLHRLGNLRSLALLYLSRGCMEIMIEAHESSSLSFARGLEIVEEIGDEDMQAQASAFLLPLYFARGQQIKIFSCLDHIFRVREGWPKLFLEGATSIFAGITAHHFQHISLAIGLARSAGYHARRLHQHIPEILWQAQLAIILFEDRRYFKQTEQLLLGIQAGLNPDLETYVYLVVTRVLAVGYCRHRKFDQGYEQLSHFVQVMTRNGMQHTLFNTPWSLEMLYVFERQGFRPIPGMLFQQELERAVNGTDPAMQGVGLRITAIVEQASGGNHQQIEELLERSVSILCDSGHSFQHQISCNVLQQFRIDADSSLKTTSIFYRPQLFQPVQDLAKACADAYLDLPQESDAQFALHRFARTTLELFSAEHLAFFSIRKGQPHQEAGYNCSDYEIRERVLPRHEAAISAALFEKRLSRSIEPGSSFLILPVPLAESPWCLYVENNLSPGQYNHLGTSELKEAARIIATELRSTMHRFQPARHNTFYRANKTAVYFGENMKSLLHQIEPAARSDAPILLLGETGVGKEVVAEYIHSISDCKGAFVPVHPASTPESLFESAFFGHEKGAFTGAIKQNIGFFEYAHEGTLFIDEVGEIPLSMQVKLLRVLQEKIFTRVGSITSRHSHFRLIAATNRDLQEGVRAGRFRQDLYYRLSVLPFTIPPLRERPEDLRYLIEMFITHFCKRYAKSNIAMLSQTLQALLRYSWPGNVRELRNVIERGVILSRGKHLHLLDLDSRPDVQNHGVSERPDGAMTSFRLKPPYPTMKEMEKQYLQFILSQTGGRISGEGSCSEILGLKPSTLYAKLRVLGISLKTFS